MYRLVFLSGRYQGKRIVVRQAVTLVGCGADCHLVLADDDRVAPQHARLEESGTGVFLFPLSPGHPVVRNGEPMLESVRLVHNDVVVIGNTRLEFQDIIAPQARLRPSPGFMQPMTILVAAAILLLEFALLAFLVNWPRHIIRPATEAQDILRAKRMRVRQIRTDKVRNAREGTTPSAPASIVAMPGTSSSRTDRPGPADATAGAAASDPADLRHVLDVADFTPAHTNLAIASLPALSIADPRIEEAQRLLAQAVTAAEFADYASAIRLLNQIHQSEPDFLPAHVEHARLLEARGDLDAARQRWSQIQGIAPEGSPVRSQAIAQRQRLDDLRRLQTELLRSPETPDLDRLPRHVRIASTGIQRLPTDVDVAEMRVVSLSLELAPSEQLFKDAILQVFITFYDSAPDAPPRPTRAITTASPTILNAAFAGRTSIPIEATYVVPRGLRAQEARETGAAYSYYGYTVHVFSGRILQDAFGKPRKLLELPLHFPGND
jgi:tetratricopeptide (TPR) repeat protein